MNQRDAVISQMTEGGAVFAVESESNRCFGFTFGKIVGYRGEQLREVARNLGMRPGVAIRVALDDRGAVESVELAPKSPEQRSGAAGR